MGEKLPEDKYQESRRRNDVGFELVEQDKADPERGPIVRQVRAVFSAACKERLDGGPVFNEFRMFQESFAKHFGLTEALRYRLYRLIIGSSPEWNSDRFDFVDAVDAEERWSIAYAMKNIAEKYDIRTEEG